MVCLKDDGTIDINKYEAQASMALKEHMENNTGGKGLDNMDIEAEVVTLNDGLDYVILDEINGHSNVLCLFIKYGRSTDFCVRKKLQNSAGSLLMGLDDENEFNMAMKLYFDKNGKKIIR